MARSKAATRRAKAAYSRRYREENPGKVLEYNRKTVKQRSSRNKARAILKKRGVRVSGKDVHHRNSNPTDNSASNLAVARAHHEGGAPRGNKNARKKRRKK